MKTVIHILRRSAPEAEPYIQGFVYELREPADTVATALTILNEERVLRDLDGKPARPIRWDCSCLQKKCGACAMRVNGRPALACAARLQDLGTSILLEPLRKFPVIEDLLVDRSLMFENLKKLRLWLDEEARQQDGDQEGNHEASRCLQCGCCLEVCPNFAPDDNFPGMAVALPMTRILAELPLNEDGSRARLYKKAFYEGCGKSLACQKICPAHLPVEELISRSNALAVWKSCFRKRYPKTRNARRGEGESKKV